MKRLLTIVLLVCVGVIFAALLWPLHSRQTNAPRQSSKPETDRMSFLTNFPDTIVSPTTIKSNVSGQVSSRNSEAPTAQTASNAKLPGSTVVTTPVSAEPDFSNPPPAVVIENMRGAFRDYAATFGGNPVGTNPEITRALNGGNPKQITFVHSEDGLRINERGELVDSWGTPFFFHQLSAREMEIHSAGPDHILWTADDLVTR